MMLDVQGLLHVAEAVSFSCETSYLKQGLLDCNDPNSYADSAHSMWGFTRGRVSMRTYRFILVATSTLLMAATFALQGQSGSAHTAATAAAPNQNCMLILPPNPLTAQGLATPYQLTATDPAVGPCNEANAAQSAFAQAAILDPTTGKVMIYSPLVIDQGTQPAIAPIVPTLPANAVVGIWFGFNGSQLTILKNAAKAAGMCVNGVPGSIFGQFAYCNAPAFFGAANKAIADGLLTIPALGTANDGKPCPTTRDFDIIDQDQSDNVQTEYLTNAHGQIAQFSAANQARLAHAAILANPSDNALLTRFIDPALGCQTLQAPDLTDKNNMISALPLDELQAAATQLAPVALIPAGDPMVLNNTTADLDKVNSYRRGVDQTPAATLNDASTTTYCQNLVDTAVPRLQLDTATFQQKPSPDNGATANSLATFLANRLNITLGAKGLNCTGQLHIQNPIQLQTNRNGMVTGATITTPPAAAGTGTGNGVNTGTGTGVGMAATPNCIVNGTAIAGCTGTTTINGQICSFAFANNNVTVICPVAQASNGNTGSGTTTGTTSAATGTVNAPLDPHASNDQTASQF